MKPTILECWWRLCQDIAASDGAEFAAIEREVIRETALDLWPGVPRDHRIASALESLIPYLAARIDVPASVVAWAHRSQAATPPSFRRVLGRTIDQVYAEERARLRQHPVSLGRAIEAVLAADCAEQQIQYLITCAPPASDWPDDQVARALAHGPEPVRTFVVRTLARQSR